MIDLFNQQSKHYKLYKKIARFFDKFRARKQAKDILEFLRAIKNMIKSFIRMIVYLFKSIIAAIIILFKMIFKIVGKIINK